MFNIHPGETFNVLLVPVQYHLQILAQQYFYAVFKISSAEQSYTMNTTQSTSLLKLYTISLCLWSSRFYMSTKDKMKCYYPSHSHNSPTSNMRVFYIQCYLLTGDCTLCTYIFLIRVIFCYIRDKCV